MRLTSWITQVYYDISRLAYHYTCRDPIVGGPAVPPDQMSPWIYGPKTRCPPSGQDVPPPGGEMGCETLTLQQIVDTQPVLLRTIAAFTSQRICTNSKTMSSLSETLLHKTVSELG